MLFKNLSFWSIFLFFSLSVSAQEIDKSRLEKNINFRLNTEIFFKNGSFIFYESNWHYGINQLFPEINSLPFYQMYHLLGYEIPFGGNWAGGLGIRQNYAHQLRMTALRGHLNHTGEFIKIVFFKELSVERFWENTSAKPFQQARFRVMLGRDFKLKKQSFRAILGYDIAKNFESESLAKNRRIQQTNLRLGIDYFLNKTEKNWSLGIYYDKQTEYFFVEEQFLVDKDTGELIPIPARRLNQILPIWSIRLHGQIFQKAVTRRVIF